MAIPGVNIGRAIEADLDGIMELQAANQPERRGMLSANLSRSRVTEMMVGRPLIVARRSGRVVAFHMNSTREMNDNVPMIRAMLDVSRDGRRVCVWPHMREGERTWQRASPGHVHGVTAPRAGA